MPTIKQAAAEFLPNKRVAVTKGAPFQADVPPSGHFISAVTV